MRKFLSSFLVLCAAYSFSFDKIPNKIIHFIKDENTNQNKRWSMRKVDLFENEGDLSKGFDKVYFIPTSKSIFNSNYYSSSGDFFLGYNDDRDYYEGHTDYLENYFLLDNNSQRIEDTSDIQIKCVQNSTNIMENVDCSFIYIRLLKNNPLDYWLTTLYNTSNNFTTHMINNICLGFQTKIQNSKEGVRLVHPLGKNIDFQKALIRYVQRYQDFSTRLSQYITNIQKNPTSQNQLESVLKISQESKTNYTQKQGDLLRNSEILAVWLLPNNEYSNKEYIQYEKALNPNFIREEKTKIVNNVIVGLAYDKKEKIPYNWQVDLGKGRDISVLFDYATEVN